MEYANMNPFRLWFQLWVAFWQTPICPPPEDKNVIRFPQVHRSSAI